MHEESCLCGTRDFLIVVFNLIHQSFLQTVKFNIQSIDLYKNVCTSAFKTFFSWRRSMTLIMA